MKVREIIDWKTRDEPEWGDKLQRALAPFLNKKVLLSGGGSWDTNTCVLKEIKLIKYTDGSVNVDVIINDIEPELFGRHEFELHLGMWKISEIIANEIEDVTSGDAQGRVSK